MELLLAAIVLVGLCVFGMCFNIIFRKDGKFPETEIETNRDMRKLGLKCAREEEMKLWGKKKKNMPECSDEDCSTCGSCK